MDAALEEEIKEHKDESESIKSDRHWKRPLKKAKVSSDDLDGRVSSALGVPDVPPLSPLNHHLEGLIEQLIRPLRKLVPRRLLPLNQPNSPYVHLLFSRRFVEAR
ncbi:uncharacterized protein LOC127149464 [Cucumis melo]|uniref:Uncharacterized protein LOC127149372 n=1 Tax=Cucumis melo TaxID=3656 RepID=A0ABM3KT69_CUCME|nr:uncharacterized protein LOC127149372 [Cucumis melo]XP_050940924.1 uncharacterized protein LOC127149457 [Cucumis melo]XP_050940930.1 uncharacterized protein LOC127149460 [Cucumis melo]XP_050940936.1 uncharacterized protein LOC127149464 [Cucumis melo]